MKASLSSSLRRNFVVLIALWLTLITSALAGMHPTHARKAMVVSVHSLATDAGVEMMRQGGNAIDAAVATGFALAVVHPQAGNIGGGGFMLIRMADGKLHFLDYREKAPAAATVDMYWDKQGNLIPDLSTLGYKAIGVPGSVAGMATAEKKWGKLGLQKVMAPAIRLARNGFPIPWEYVRSFQSKRLTEFPESRRIFQRDGNFYQAGEVFKQPELARTLERIAADPENFYHGELAKQIAAAIQKGGGIVTAQDLANYQVKEREAVHGTYRGYDVYSAPPPSSGGVALIEILNMLEKFDLPSLGGGSAEAIKPALATASNLMVNGVLLSGGCQPNYVYNQLNEIKPTMICRLFLIRCEISLVKLNASRSRCLRSVMSSKTRSIRLVWFPG